MENRLPVNELRRGLLELSEGMSAILDAVDGYKSQLLERTWV